MNEWKEDDLCQDDLKGGIGGVVDCTTACLDERCRHHRPSGPVTTLKRAPINVVVGSGIACSSTPSVSATPKVLPVTDRMDAISTIPYTNNLHSLTR